MSEAPLDPIHYMTLYLMTEPVERTLREFMQLGRDLHAVGPVPPAPAGAALGPVPVRATRRSRRGCSISAEAVPYRPNLGVYVEVEELAASDGGDAAPTPPTHLARAVRGAGRRGRVVVRRRASGG